MRILLERKDLEKNRIFALPEEMMDDKVRVHYNEAGTIDKITEKDGTDDYWGYNGIVFVPKCMEPAKEKYQTIERMLRQLPVDFEALQKSGIQKTILDYEIISGNLYISRASGLKNKEPKNFCLAFILDPSIKPKLDIQSEEDTKNIFINIGKSAVSLEGTNFEFAVNFYKAKTELFKAGEIRIHRKTLNPFYSTGTYGSTHSNPSNISILDKKLSDMEHPDSYKSEIIT